MISSNILSLLIFCVIGFELILAKSRESSSLPDGSCRELGRCCQGKDNSCRVRLLGNEKWNAIEIEKKEKLNETSSGSSACFCDSICIKLNDCCSDYHDFCKSVDCIVASHWDNWSECDSRCGAGIKQRTRKILQVPLNGGTPCPSTVEKIACEGINCKIARTPEGYEQQRETAKIIPAAFGNWRESKLYHPFKDIRKNLFEHYETKNRIERPSYCTVFEVTEVQAACNSPAINFDVWSNGLTKGAEVCVECQELAMKKKLGSRCKGEGTLHRETRWNAVMVPGCHGKWKMLSRQEECTCNSEQQTSFILL